MTRARRAGIVAGLGVTLGLLSTMPARTQEGAASALRIGERITLDLKGVDILDVLKLFSQKSGLNFVAGRNVSGRVTIFVNDVDVWEAFERIVAANDLAYELQGDIVTVMLARDYELMLGDRFQDRKQHLMVPLTYAKVIQVATVLNQVKSSIGQVVADETTNTLIVHDVPNRLAHMRRLLEQLDRPIQSRVYSLNYVKAEDLKGQVQELLSPVGTFTFDKRTNRAVVVDLPEILARTDELVEAFDTPTGQVLIEAKVLKVDLKDDMDLGIDWQHVFSGIDSEVRGNFSVLSDDVLTKVTSTATGKGVQFHLLQSPIADAQLIIEALQTLTDTETLSNPRIMVSSGEEAKIQVATSEAVVTTTTTVPATGSTVSSPEIQFVDVGTILSVTPEVKRDGYIQIKVRPEVSSSTTVEFKDNRIPIVTSTEAETTVLVKSGVTLIIGGLISTKDAATQKQIPLLGDVPIVGRLFKSTDTTVEKTELVVFLTPQIIMPDGSPYVEPSIRARAFDEAMPAIVLRAPVPASYREQVRERLQGYLTSQFLADALERGSVVVSFILNHDGTLARDGDIASPQGEAFVAAAREALQRAQPFPPFPAGSTASEVRFRLAVDYDP